MKKEIYKISVDRRFYPTFQVTFQTVISTAFGYILCTYNNDFVIDISEYKKHIVCSMNTACVDLT